jgi:hypothetical protein
MNRILFQIEFASCAVEDRYAVTKGLTEAVAHAERIAKDQHTTVKSVTRLYFVWVVSE